MTTVFTLAGAFGAPDTVAPDLHDEVAGAPDVTSVVPILYPNWGIGSMSQVQTGAQMLDTSLTGTTGKKVVLAHSLGSVACCYWLANYGAASTIPAADLSFILLGNSNRPYGGFCKAIGWFQNCDIPLDTRYAVTDFARQYDGWADWPSAVGTFGAAFDNGLEGQGFIHPNYMGVSLEDAGNVSYTPQVGGAPSKITYMWSISWPVPLIMSVSQNAQNESADRFLRPFVEAGYTRPVAIGAPAYPGS